MLPSSAKPAMIGQLGRDGLPILQGLVGALLGVSPLARVHRVAAVLLDLATLTARDLTFHQLSSWLQQALISLPSGEYTTMWHGWMFAVVSALSLACISGACHAGLLAPGEAQAVYGSWVGLLEGASAEAVTGTGNVCGNDLLGSNHGRNLKKAVRNFAELHDREAC